jgi:hypothetical protein
MLLLLLWAGGHLQRRAGPRGRQAGIAAASRSPAAREECRPATCPYKSRVGPKVVRGVKVRRRRRARRPALLFLLDNNPTSALLNYLKIIILLNKFNNNVLLYNKVPH